MVAHHQCRAASAAVYLTRERPARMDDNVTPLLLLLRKYVRNGRLIAVEQPPWERVLQFTVHARVDDDIVETTLIAEIMGRTSNLVLVDADGVVLESMKRVDTSINRYRQVLPKQPYVPPPPLQRPDPFSRSSHAIGSRRPGKSETARLACVHGADQRLRAAAGA